MAESPPKRVLPARERRESFKMQASSPSTPAPVASPTLKKNSPLQVPETQPQPQPQPQVQTATEVETPTGEPRVKRKYVRRAPLKSERQRRNSTPLSEEALPARFISSTPLPTVESKPRCQDFLTHYQSIANSAILAASLHRSRVKWLCDGIFDRYWTKPSKKKGAPEVASNNPDQKSMQKLGTVTLAVEPHTFDAVVYTVRDVQPPPIPYARHPNQHPPKYQSPLVQQHTPIFASPMAPSPNPNLSATHPHPQPSAHKKIKQEAGSVALPPTATGPSPSPVTSNASQSAQITPPAQPPQKLKPSADPVIQMLASRAASDPRLKDLMKVVATSKASPAQLKEFQAHIDEFNAVIRQAEVEKSKSQSSVSGPLQLDGGADEKPLPMPHIQPPISAPGAVHPATYGPNSAPSPAGLMRPGMPGMPTNVPIHAPYPAYPPPRPEALVRHIILELTSPASSGLPASQDRWLFPPYAVLDSPISGRGLEMICSFFVERKGTQLAALNGPSSAEESTTSPIKFKADTEYYQPVTMTLRASQHRTLETIARAAKPLSQVQSYMEEVMKEKTQAPNDYLTLQLPIEKKEDRDVQMADFTDSAVELSPDEDEELKDYYGNY